MFTEAQIQTTFIKVLNDAFKLDPKAMQALVDLRVKCNQALVNHPTIQVTINDEVGILGIINGILEELTKLKLGGNYDDDDKLTGFVAVPNPRPRYRHNCDFCVYLGEFNDFDLYYCDKYNVTVVARWGDEFMQAKQLLGNPDKNDPALKEAVKRAKLRGYKIEYV